MKRELGYLLDAKRPTRQSHTRLWMHGATDCESKVKVRTLESVPQDTTGYSIQRMILCSGVGMAKRSADHETAAGSNACKVLKPNMWLQATAVSQPLGQFVLGRGRSVNGAAPEPRR